MQSELKHGAPWFIRGRPKASAMRLDDGVADGETHAYAVWLRRVERLEHAAERCRGEP